MRKWLSSYVVEQPEVKGALSDLEKLIRLYKDAAHPSAYREAKRRFLSTELAWFRPGWKLFAVVSVVCGVAGIVFSYLTPSYDKAGEWAILAIRISVPTFTIGISLVALSRTISETGRFAGEYLNDACRTPLFCCLTLIAVLCGLVGRFVSTIEWVPNFLTMGVCAISVGTSMNSLAMLAFVILETIRCSIPTESIRVVSKYAARKLTYGYLNDCYAKLFRYQYNNHLQEWCIAKATHGPSHYYEHYLQSSLYSGKGDNDVRIEIDGGIARQDLYKDYDLKGLEKLDRYLKRNDAEFYLSSTDYGSEGRAVGILRCVNVKKNERVKEVVQEGFKKLMKWRICEFLENDDDFWDSQERAHLMKQ